MHCITWKYLLVPYCLFVSCNLCAQSSGAAAPATGSVTSPPDSLRVVSPLSQLYTVGNIIVTGNRKTKPFIIKRELSFQQGDSLALADLMGRFGLARRQLMNTRLFNEVIISLAHMPDSKVIVTVDVKERWYLFPLPFFKPVDRNLSEWARQGYGLDRVNYGAKLAHYNATGRNDKLKAQVIHGYTPQVQFSYEQPNADKSLRHGYGVSVSYTTAKELNYLTLNNEQRYIPSTPPVRLLDSSFHRLFHRQVLSEQFNATLTYTYRRAIRTRHSFRLMYNVNKIDRAVSLANPNYYNNGKLSISYPEFIYTVEYNNVDYVVYPLTGLTGDASFTKRGISKDMNLWQLNARAVAGWKIASNLFFGVQGYGVLKAPFAQPYVNQRLLGYGDAYLRGLEKYVIDGLAGGMVRTTLRKQALNFTLPLFHKVRSLDKIPFRIYVKTYADAGYSYSRNEYYNPLANKLLYTGGAGIDIVTFYDFVFRFEYSFNQLKQKGLFLHLRNDF